MTTYSNISPDAYQIGGLWTRDGSQSLCADCMFMPPRLGVFCSMGAQIVPTIVCSEYTLKKLILDAEQPVGNPISRVDALRTAHEILERAEQERAQLAEMDAKRGLQLDEEQNELLENIVGAFAAYQPGDEQRSRDTRILDWIEEEKPDIWFRT